MPGGQGHNTALLENLPVNSAHFFVRGIISECRFVLFEAVRQNDQILEEFGWEYEGIEKKRLVGFEIKQSIMKV